MKKTELCVVMVILLILALMMCGCQEQAKIPDRIPLIIDAHNKFVKLNSLQHWKIGETIIALHKRIEALEDPNGK